MSDKMTCPACDATTSNVTSAFRGGLPCPYCGLPADAAGALSAARERGAGAQVVEMAGKAEVRAVRAEAEVVRLRGLLDKVRRALSAADGVGE